MSKKLIGVNKRQYRQVQDLMVEYPGLTISGIVEYLIDQDFKLHTDVDIIEDPEPVINHSLTLV